MAHSMNLKDEISKCSNSPAVCAVLKKHFTQKTVRVLSTALSEVKTILSRSKQKTKEKKSVIPKFMKNVDIAIELVLVIEKLPQMVKADLANKDQQKREVERELKTIKDRQKKENDRNLLAKENEIQELKAQISHQEKKKTEKQTIIVQLKADIDYKHQQQIELRYEATKQELQIMKEKADKLQRQAQIDMAKTDQEKKELERKFLVKNEELLKLKSQLHECQEHEQKVVAQLKTNEKKYQEKEQELQTLKQELQDLVQRQRQTDLANKAQQKQEAERQSVVHNEELLKLKSQLHECQEHEQECEAQLKTNEKKCQEKEQELQTAKEQLRDFVQRKANRREICLEESEIINKYRLLTEEKWFTAKELLDEVFSAENLEESSRLQMLCDIIMIPWKQVKNKILAHEVTMNMMVDMVQMPYDDILDRHFSGRSQMQQEAWQLVKTLPAIMEFKKAATIFSLFMVLCKQMDYRISYDKYLGDNVQELHFNSVPPVTENRYHVHNVFPAVSNGESILVKSKVFLSQFTDESSA